MINKFYEKIKTSVWLYPGLYSFFALILAIVVYSLDSFYSEDISNYFYEFLFTTPSKAETILGIVAGSFITIATFTFSTTMIVLTMYSSQFTPRVVENFLNNEVTMKSFGVFLSGFIYAITSLLFLQSDEGTSSVIAASIGVIYVILGLVYFLVFIQNVTSHIQANGLIMRLQKDASEKIKDYWELVNDAEIISGKDMDRILGNKESFDVMAPTDGYIQTVDYSSLEEIAHKYSLNISVHKVIGQFVSTERRIMEVYYDDEEIGKEEIIKKISQCVMIGYKKTESQDFPFTIQKVSEIALKALSPGINDPNTAIHCLQIIGLLLRDLAGIERGYIMLKDNDREGNVLLETYDFDILLYDAYNQIIHYGQEDASVMIATFKSLRLVKDNASKKNTGVLNYYANELIERLMSNGYSSIDEKKIKKEHQDLIQR